MCIRDRGRTVEGRRLGVEWNVSEVVDERRQVDELGQRALDGDEDDDEEDDEGQQQGPDDERQQEPVVEQRHERQTGVGRTSTDGWSFYIVTSRTHRALSLSRCAEIFRARLPWCHVTE